MRKCIPRYGQYGYSVRFIKSVPKTAMYKKRSKMELSSRLHKNRDFSSKLVFINIFLVLSLFPFVFGGSSVQTGDHIVSQQSDQKIKSPNDAYESFRQITDGDNLIQQRLFNTSIVITVPLFSFTLPQTASQGEVADLANQVS